MYLNVCMYVCMYVLGRLKCLNASVREQNYSSPEIVISFESQFCTVAKSLIFMMKLFPKVSLI
jgi:hypothetical protein